MFTPSRATGSTRAFARVGRMSALVLVIMLAISFCQIPVARAAGSGPIIHWNSSMIYAGQNNGYPWGPVGEHAGVSGERFSAGQQLRLILVQGDSNNDATVCKTTGVDVGTLTTDSSGTFSQQFSWPAGAGQVNAEYSICAISTVDGSVASDQDDGPFTVLASSPPAVSVSPGSVTAGNTITITGQNWVPPQQVNISVVSCVQCGDVPPIASTSATSTGLNTGSFSATLTIPTNTQAATYYVTAAVSGGQLTTDANNPQSLSVAAVAPTPTPSPAPTPSPTATFTPTATPVPTAVTTAAPTPTATGASSTSSGRNQGVLIGLLVAIALVLAAIVGVVVYMLMHRAANRRTPPGGPSSTPGQYVQPLPPGGSPSDPGAYTMPTSSPSTPNRYMQPTPPGSPSSDPNWQSTIASSSPIGRGSNPSACPKCGSPLSPDEAFCGQCGTYIGGS